LISGDKKEKRHLKEVTERKKKGRNRVSLTNSRIWLHSRIGRSMLQCGLSIWQTLCWNGQVERIYIKVISVLSHN
jgi:hypothetical protein